MPARNQGKYQKKWQNIVKDDGIFGNTDDIFGSFLQLSSDRSILRNQNNRGVAKICEKRRAKIDKLMIIWEVPAR